MQEETPFEQFDRTMNTNVRSAVMLTKFCIPHLRKSKGSVVNVSSIGGLNSFSGVGNYCMSKAALDMYTKCLALELAADNVRVNSVNPGMIDTAIFGRAGILDKDYAAFLEEGAKTHPLGRIGTVDECADCICFLASSKASFITGNLTSMDGGKNCLCP